MVEKKVLTFVTASENKSREIASILGDQIPYRLVCKGDLDLLEYQGEVDFIAKQKCRYALERVNGAVMTEDTSLGFNAFSGLPGPYIKYFQETIGSDGLYRMLHTWEDKSAVATCTIAFCSGVDEDIQLFKGEIKGKIVQPAGSGYGWDSCFMIDGWTETLAQGGFEKKNTTSHRYFAAIALRQYLLENAHKV